MQERFFFAVDFWFYVVSLFRMNLCVCVVMFRFIKNPSKCNNITFNRFYECVTFLFILFYFKKLLVIFFFGFCAFFSVCYHAFLCCERAILIGLYYNGSRVKKNILWDKKYPNTQNFWFESLSIIGMNIIYL